MSVYVVESVRPEFISVKTNQFKTKAGAERHRKKLSHDNNLFADYFQVVKKEEPKCVYIVKFPDGTFQGKQRYNNADDISQARVYGRIVDVKNSISKYREKSIEIIKCKITPIVTTESISRPSWQDYFLGLASLVSKRSHDAETQHGCVIVDNDNRIVGTGYNGYPRGMVDNTLPNKRPQKYPWMIHSEVNAVSNALHRPKGCIAYVTGEPCNNCVMHLWQNGVTKIIYANAHGSKLIDEKTRMRLKTFINQTGMEIVAVEPNLSWLRQI
jgi:dCMP deaminase